jgi:RNA polymerase sigma-70 factor, ECF subfamily
MDFNETPRVIAGCIAGDERAIEQLIQLYQTGVFRLALSVLDDPLEANEAAQDTFIAALGALGNYQDQATFKAWLYTIALNVA